MTAEDRHEAKEGRHTVFGVCVFNGLEILTYGNVADLNSIEYPEPLFEVHKIVNSVHTSANLKHKIVGTLSVTDKITAESIMAIEPAELIKVFFDIRYIELKL